MQIIKSERMSYKGKVVVNVKPKKGEQLPWTEVIHLKFVSVKSDGFSEEGKSIDCQAQVQHDGEVEHMYKAEIDVSEGFGEIGAVIVTLEKDVNERFIETIIIEFGTLGTSVKFSCKSWVQPKRLIDQRRIFFSSNKSYLLGNTPKGLVKLRAEDLANLRGEDHAGRPNMKMRKAFERIYDYDVYNDLGDPDKSMDLKRPVLGGSEDYPYPRRCRTGRPLCENDPNSEKRSEEWFYVPRDEEFSEIKQLISEPGNKNLLGKSPFSDLPDMDIKTPSAASKINLQFNISSMVSSHQPAALNPSDPVPSTLIEVPPPDSYERDKYNWLSDFEFARLTLAGLNPYSIQLVKKLPFMSKLNEKDYGSQESLFTEKRVQELLGSSIIVKKALEDKRLFVLDYHDILMPYVNKVRSIKGTTLYGSRTLFFRNTTDDTLMPLGIELTRPPNAEHTKRWREIFTPSTTYPTEVWQWRFAKAHVLAHDSCIHQLVIHWLRAHCCMEPYAIATNRQLSTMHPIYRLLHPHFRYNMRINANARKNLINARGIIESAFSAASYSMELSSSVYKEWRFDEQALPKDLIRRGMAERKNDNALELTIKDYPFANDGLLLWNALLEWMTEYVNHYYKDDNAVVNDTELYAWWKEIQEKGHPDIKEGWPTSRTRDDLIKIASTIAWVGSGHHASVNFLQYAYGGYTPNRPSIARTNMVTEKNGDGKFHKDFISHPERQLLKLFPSDVQAAVVKQTMMLLSVHSPDEEYIGDEIELAWVLEPSISNAFKKFKDKLKNLEKETDNRNQNKNLKNRYGAGIIPYEAMKPHSKPGITGSGVPYSVSI